MSQDVQSTTITENFDRAFDRYFTTGDVFLRVHNGKTKIQYYGFSERHVAFRIPHAKSLKGEYVVFRSIANTMVYAYLKFLNREEDGTFIFTPIRIQIISQGRDEDRESIEDNEKKKSIVFITNVISDFMILNSLSMSMKKVDVIRDTIIDDTDNAFEHIKIHLANEGRSDARMKHFSSERNPIYIQNYSAAPSEKDRQKINYYINNIMDSDHYLKNHRELISEISIPLLLYGRIPYGYLQVNSSTSLTKETFASLKQFAISSSMKFIRHGIFFLGTEKLIVTNVSRKGFGISFKDRKVMRYFKDKCLVSCDMMLPGGEKASFYTSVKHITINKNKSISIGFNTIDIDALGEVYYDDFIDKITEEKSQDK